MAPANSSTRADISDIQRRMAQIRHEMHQEVQGAVKGAQLLTDWRTLFRNHPWLSLGVAAAAGYLIVPQRRREVPAVTAVSAPPVQAAPPPAPRDQPTQARRPEWSTMGTIFSLLAPLAVRVAQNYALQRFQEWLEAHPLHPAGSGHGRPDESDSMQTVPTGPPARFRDSGREDVGQRPARSPREPNRT